MTWRRFMASTLSAVHCSVSEILGCSSRAVSRPRSAGGMCGSSGSSRMGASQSSSTRGRRIDGHRQRRGHQGEQERDTVHAGEGREAHRDVHIDAGVAQRQPGEAERAVGHLDRHPQGRHRGSGPPAPHQGSGQRAEHAHVQRLGHGEQQEDRPARRVAQAAVKGEHELDPVADAEPVDHARGPAQQEAARPARLARHRDQQRGERHGRKPDDGESRKGENEQRGRSQRQQPVQHDSRCASASSLTRSAM